MPKSNALGARHGMFARILTLVGVLVGGVALAGGAEYYLTPVPERPFSAAHDIYAPTGLFGHGFGVIGTLMIAGGVVLYAARKRLRFLSRFGSLKHWLHFHIFLCLLGPFLVLLHTTFKFGGIVAIAFWSMALVVASGVFGRWVYVWIPKTVNGRFLEAEEIRGRMHDLLAEVGERISIEPERLYALLRAPHETEGTGKMTAVTSEGAVVTWAKPTTTEPATTPASVASRASDRRRVPRPGPDRRGRSRLQPSVGAAVRDTVRFGLTARRERRLFARRLDALGVTPVARETLLRHRKETRRIEQQLRLLDPLRRAFRYWHAFHLPLAVVMTVVLAAHVAVAVAFGYTWIF